MDATDISFIAEKIRDIFITRKKRSSGEQKREGMLAWEARMMAGQAKGKMRKQVSEIKKEHGKKPQKNKGGNSKRTKEETREEIKMEIGR